MITRRSTAVQHRLKSEGPQQSAVPLASRGLHSALAVPGAGPDGPVAVLSFYSSEHRVPTASVVRTLPGIGRELGRFLSRRVACSDPGPLSTRELEVLRLAVEGRSGPQIADSLVLSPSTVKTHFENIYEKLGVGDRPAAVAHAVRTGLIE
jgi:DNA-binding NarL/FixJ family response regulator